MLMDRRTDRVRLSQPSADGWFRQVPPVESRVPPAWTCVDTAGHEDKPGEHWVVPACVPAYVTGARGVDTAAARGATGVCAASRIRIRPRRFLSEFIRGL